MANKYKLTPQARQDLKNVAEYGKKHWHRDQVRAYIVNLKNVFDTFVRFPKMGEIYEAHPSHRIRKYSFSPYVIFYQEEIDHILAIRVFRASQNYQAFFDRY